MPKQNTINAVPVEIIKQQYDAINAKGEILLKETRGIGVDLNTWKKYPCIKEDKCTEDDSCFTTISIFINAKFRMNIRKDWKRVPPNLVVLAIREGKRTFIIFDKTMRDFVDEKIFVISKSQIESVPY
ncbi:MAG: hypothetical protein LBH42_02535 [Treponema sp.]|jgi:hypothetical protein|nr:hypothetical protein [Treponema sp.]